MPEGLEDSALDAWRAMTDAERDDFFLRVLKPPPLESPGLMAMAASFGKAVVAHVADGARHATPEAQAARKATCEACPLLDAAGDRCTACGCALNLKRSWASSACPEGKWGPE